MRCFNSTAISIFNILLYNCTLDRYMYIKEKNH